MKLVLLSIIFFFALNLCAQPFVNATSDYMLNYNSSYPMFGSGISLFDFNNDGFDDITFCSNEFGVQTFVNSGNSFTQIPLFDYYAGDFKHAVWIDFDNDSDYDFFATRANGRPLFMRNLGQLVFENIGDFVFENYSELIAMGCTWADVDLDGWVDLYIGVYNQYVQSNLFFKNINGEQFVECANELQISDGFRLTYQPLFVDFDMDFDMDLIVVNDRDDGNHLYENDNGFFTDISESSGFNIPCDGMSATTADYDNDGDFDFYITNTEEGNQLLKNNNGLFEDIASQSDAIVNGWCWGASWIDSFNDGVPELVVTGGAEIIQDNYFLSSDSEDLDVYFTTEFSTEDDFGQENYCVAKGDLNHDGALDLVFTSISPSNHSIWLNQAEVGNWINVTLSGTISNINATGSIATVYAGSDVYYHQWLCGENLFGQNSQHVLIGLGDHEIIDSVLIHWPSGWTDKYFNLNTDEYYYFIEGETSFLLNTYESYSLCANDSLLFVVPDTIDFESWNDGDTSRSKWIYSAGNYSAEIRTELGFPYFINFEMETLIFPDFDLLVIDPSCHAESNGQIQLIADINEINSVIWEDGGQDFIRIQLGNGLYSINLFSSSGCALSEDVTLVSPPPIQLVNALDTIICEGVPFNFTPSFEGGVSPFTYAWLNELTPNNSGTQTLLAIDSNNCLEEFDISIQINAPIDIEIMTDTVCSGETTAISYSVAGGYGELTFDFGGINVNAVPAGEFQLIAIDELGCSSDTTFEVFQWQPLNIDSTSLTNLANGFLQIEFHISGGVPPYSYAWSDGATSSALTTDQLSSYSCLVTDLTGCTITAEIDKQLLLVESLARKFDVYPTIFDQFLVFNQHEKIGVYDLTGKLILNSSSMDQSVIDTSNWPSGMYFYISEGSNAAKLIKK
jgi:hypothetical protein